MGKKALVLRDGEKKAKFFILYNVPIFCLNWEGLVVVLLKTKKVKREISEN